MLTQQTHSDNKGWDILGLGQAMVDFSAAVDDDFLVDLGLKKGGRRSALLVQLKFSDA